MKSWESVNLPLGQTYPQVRSGSVRDPFGIRSESVRAPKRKTPIYYCSQSSARSRYVQAWKRFDNDPDWAEGLEGVHKGQLFKVVS